MLTGNKPFTGRPTELVRKIFSEPLPPSGLNPQLLKETDEIVLKALRKRKEERYKGMWEFFKYSLRKLLDAL